MKIKIKGGKMEIGITLLIGLCLGVGSTIIGTKITNKTPIVIEDKTSQTQQEIIKQLTDLDIIKEICAPGNMTKIEDRLLCREFTCLIYSRGIDSQTSGKSCEEIQNLSNTVSLIDYCKTKTENETACYDVFYRRK